MLDCRCILLILLGPALLAFGQSHPRSIATIESLLRAQRPGEALQSVQAALRSAPGDTRLWTLRGIALSMEGKSREASLAFEHALRLAPDDLAALRGEAQILEGEHDRRAIPLLHRILALAPGDSTAHEMLALDEAQAGNCKAALADFRRSGIGIERHSASLESYGNCLHQAGDGQQAIAVFQELANGFPQLPYVKYDLALVMFDAKQYASALQVLEPLVQPGSADPDVLSLASQAYEAEGNTPQAVMTLRRAILLDPTDANRYNAFAKLCLDHDSFRVGIDMVDVGLRYNPHAASLYLSRGLLYAQLSQFDKAEADFDTATRLDPLQALSSYAIDLAELQKYHLDRSHSSQAVKDVRSQIKLHPDSFLLHFLLAKLLTTQGPENEAIDFTQAEIEAETAVQLKPDFVAARDLLARIDLSLRNYSAAAEECRDALRYEPGDHVAIYHLITALRHLTGPQDKAEMQVMVKRLSRIELNSRQSDIHRKQFRLVEQPQPAPQSSGNN